MSFITVVVFVLIFSLLVLVHEAGHYFAAKKAGVKVEEFGLGLPPRIWGKRKYGTIWSFNWIPFGGFVRLKGEDGENTREKDSMAYKRSGPRLLIIVAGVLMNFLLAYVLLIIGFWFGMAPMALDLKALGEGEYQSKVIVLDVVKSSPAQIAGIKAGDTIISVGDTPITLVSELQNILTTKTSAKLVVEREGKLLALTVVTKADDGKRVIGVLIDEVVASVKYTWWKVPYYALLDFVLLVKHITGALVVFIVHLFTTASIQESVSGPVGIAKVASEAMKLGWLYTLQLVAFLSINLGLINIVPFPALDGGRLIFVLFEMGRGGKKVSKKVENAIHSLGFILLLALIFAVTYRDIIHLFKPA